MKDVYDIQNLIIGQISTVNNTPSGIMNLRDSRIFIYEQLIVKNEENSKKGKKDIEKKSAEKVIYNEVFTEEDSYHVSGVLKEEDLEKQEFGKIYLINNVDIRNYLNEDEKLIGKIEKKRLLDIYQQIIFDYAKNHDSMSTIESKDKILIKK